MDAASLLADVVAAHASAEGFYRSSIASHAREAAWLLKHGGTLRDASRLYRHARENARIYRAAWVR